MWFEQSGQLKWEGGSIRLITIHLKVENRWYFCWHFFLKINPLLLSCDKLYCIDHGGILTFGSLFQQLFVASFLCELSEQSFNFFQHSSSPTQWCFCLWAGRFFLETHWLTFIIEHYSLTEFLLYRLLWNV